MYLITFDFKHGLWLLQNFRLTIAWEELKNAKFSVSCIRPYFILRNNMSLCSLG